MPHVTTRDRLVEAAFELFAGQGFDGTTVDDIAQRAGVGRTTFFRAFATKEAVVFPDHALLLAQVDARLSTADHADAPAALYEAALVVLRHYLAEGDLAQARYRLTRTVPALRDAEIAGQRHYQRLFRTHLQRWLAGPEHAVRVEVLANAVVTAHNHVLREWLCERTGEPEADLRAAVGDVVERLWPAEPGGRARVVVVGSDLGFEDLVARVRTALEP